MSYCPTLSGNGVPQLIDSQVDKLFGYGNNAYNLSIEAMQSIRAAFDEKVKARGLNLNPPIPSADELIVITDYTMPDKPETTALTFTLPTPPPSPPVFTDIDIQPGTAPSFNGTDPVLAMPPRPNAFSASRPDDPGDIEIPDYPADPAITPPPVPSLRSYNLPSAPDIDVDPIMDEFRALYALRPSRPHLDVQDNYLVTIDQQYLLVGSRAKEFIDQCPALANLCPRLGELLAGGSTGIPADVEQAMRDRAFSAQDKIAQQNERQVNGDWLSRGFTLPSGVLDAKITVVRNQAWAEKTSLSRDIYIEAAKMEIDNLRFALQQGIILEGQYWDRFLKLYDACQAVAGALFDIQYKAVALRLEVYKAELAAWRDYAEFFKAWLQAELSRLEVYKAELESRKILGELNQQDVELYKAQLEGVNATVTIFAKRIDAANARLQGELSQLEVFKTRMQGYAVDATVNESEWKAYTSAIQGELGKAEFAKVATQAYAARVDAFKATEETKQAQGKLTLDSQRVRLEAWSKKVDEFNSLLQAETSRFESDAKRLGVLTNLFSAQVQGETARSEVETRRAGLYVQKYGIDTGITIEEAKLAQQEAIESARIAVQALGDIARTAAQLSAGSLSAINMTAGMSHQFNQSESVDCRTSYNIDAS